MDKERGREREKGREKDWGWLHSFTSTGLLLEFLDSLESYELQLLAWFYHKCGQYSHMPHIGQTLSIHPTFIWWCTAQTLQPNTVQTLAVWTLFVWCIVCSERLLYKWHSFDTLGVLGTCWELNFYQTVKDVITGVTSYLGQMPSGWIATVKNKSSFFGFVTWSIRCLVIC